MTLHFKVFTAFFWGIALLWSSFAYSDTYHMEFDLERGEIAVSAELQSVVSDEKVCLPAFGQRFGENLSIQKMQTESSPKIVLNVDNAGCFVGLNANLFRIQYTLQMAQLPPGHYWLASKLSPYAANGYLAFPGESLFLERYVGRNSKPKRATTVTVYGKRTISTLQTPPSIDGMERLKDDKNRPSHQSHQSIGNSERIPQLFWASTPEELTRSFWTFGNASVVRANTGSTEWTIFADSQWQAPLSAIESEISRILSHYAEWIPDRTSKQIAVFLFHAPFDADYRHGFARAGGIILQMGRQAAARSRDRRILMAHELFHLYNGENLRFDELEYAKTAWFREGMTQYIAIHALLTLKLLSQNQHHEWISDALTRQSIPHEPNPDDAYFQGYFLSMAIEQQWRLFQTPYTLMGFWQWLSHQPYWGLRYGNAGLQSILSSYSAFDFGDFFKRYVEGSTPLPVDMVLKASGLCRYTSTMLDYSSGLEYGYDPTTATLYVQHIVTNSPAWHAGLRRNMRLEPVPDMAWHDVEDKVFSVPMQTGKKTFRIPVQAQRRTGVIVRPCAP